MSHTRKGKRLFLDTEKILVHDEDPESRYFGVDEFNPKLTGGKNVIVINGSEKLKAGAQIQIEVLDLNNDPLYIEVGRSTGNVKFREGIGTVVSIHVQGSTPVGNGKIIIAGTRKDGRRVRWQRQISINSKLNNITKVRFYKSPEILVESSLSRVGSFNTQSQQISSGSASSLAVSPTEGADYIKFDTLRNETIYKLITPSASFNYEMTDQDIVLTNVNLPNESNTFEFTSKIKEVINDTELVTSLPFSFPNTPTQKIVKNIQSADYTIQHSPIPVSVEIADKKSSVAKVVLKNLRTFTGNVARVKLYKTSFNKNSDDELIADVVINARESFIDNETINRQKEKLGFFIDESIINTYWSTGSNSISATRDSSKILNGMKLEGSFTNDPSEYYIVKDDTDIGSTSSFRHEYEAINDTQISHRAGSSWDSNFFTLFKDVEYSFNSTVYNDRVNSTADANLTFYLTSSGLDYKTSEDFNGSNLPIFTSNFKSGVSKTRIKESTTFTLKDDFQGTLVLHPDTDGFIVSDISIKPRQAFSFNPDIFILRIPFPVSAPNEKAAIRADLFDINNNSITANLNVTKEFDEDGESIKISGDDVGVVNDSLALGGIPADSYLKRLTSTGDPGSGVGIGVMVFDTVLGIPIWYNGSNWVNATGNVEY